MAYLACHGPTRRGARGDRAWRRSTGRHEPLNNRSTTRADCATPVSRSVRGRHEVDAGRQALTVVRIEGREGIGEEASTKVVQARRGTAQDVVPERGEVD